MRESLPVRVAKHGVLVETTLDQFAEVLLVAWPACRAASLSFASTSREK